MLRRRRSRRPMRRHGTRRRTATRPRPTVHRQRRWSDQDYVARSMWEKLGDDAGIHDKDTLYDWEHAFTSKIATLNSTAFAGYSDWRLPKLRELQSLADYGAVAPSVSAAFNS